MEFDWSSWIESPEVLGKKAIEEAFEDPFCLRMLPDAPYGETENRYFLLGKSVSNLGIFAVFWTDGKKYRVIAAREMTVDEAAFYERKNAEIL